MADDVLNTYTKLEKCLYQLRIIFFHDKSTGNMTIVWPGWRHARGPIYKCSQQQVPVAAPI